METQVGNSLGITQPGNAKLGSQHSQNDPGISILAGLEAPVDDGFIIVVFSRWSCCLIFWGCSPSPSWFFPWHRVEVSWPAGLLAPKTRRGKRFQKQGEHGVGGGKEAVVSHQPWPGALSPRLDPGSTGPTSQPVGMSSLPVSLRLRSAPR